MNNDIKNPSTHPMPDSDSINKRVATAVHSHRVKLRVLTASAFAFGFLAIIISLWIAWAWRVMYWPKQEEMIQESQKAVALVDGAANSPEESVKRINNLLHMEVFLTGVISMGVATVAQSVGVLGLGMLVLLTMVILSRRVTLNQINSNLAQISSQLRELQNARGSP